MGDTTFHPHVLNGGGTSYMILYKIALASVDHHSTLNTSILGILPKKREEESSCSGDLQPCADDYRTYQTLALCPLSRVCSGTTILE